MLKLTITLQCFSIYSSKILFDSQQRYGYETENLQSLALQLGCKARSLKGEVKARGGENDRNRANTSHCDVPTRRLTIGILSAVTDLVATLKSLVGWMDK